MAITSISVFMDLVAASRVRQILEKAQQTTGRLGFHAKAPLLPELSLIPAKLRNRWMCLTAAP
jgi:hypothetical protein